MSFYREGDKFSTEEFKLWQKIYKQLLTLPVDEFPLQICSYVLFTHKQELVGIIILDGEDIVTGYVKYSDLEWNGQRLIDVQNITKAVSDYD